LHSYLAGKKFAKAVVLASFLALSGQSKAADWSLPVTGNLLGTVVDAAGNPQMGSRVELLNKYDRLISRTLSTTGGRFAFAGLASDVYAIRVSLNGFLPAFKDKIFVRAGANSMLQIHMSTLFSNIQLNSTVPTGGMSSDWKWVLRSSPATRPITRFLPDDSSVAANAPPQVFSGTHMMLGVSGSGSGIIDSESAVSDLGTRFALSTNVYGKNQIQLAGSFGQSMDVSGTAFGLCAIYSRNDGFGFATAPEITLTMSQIGLLGGQGGQMGTMAGTMRTMSLSMYETADPLDNVHLEYGMTGESVDYLQHTSRVSPFARVSVNIGALGTVVSSFSDGGRPDELTAHQTSSELSVPNPPADDLSTAVNAMARVAQISTRNGRLELQRTESFEMGWNKTRGSRTYAVSAFSEIVSNGRLNVAGDLSSLPAGDVLSDGISQTSTFNIGNYHRNGYMASASQRLTDWMDLDVGYGRMGGFTTRQGTLENPAMASSFLRSENHNLATVGLNTRIARTGTRLGAEYGWTDRGASLPQHVFTTQSTYAAPGLNIYFKQPLPSMFGLPGHLELTGDLRNLLSEGYLPLLNSDGRKMLIVQAPKAIRGGVSFTF
jgi:hypothetical protein